ncbi:MAG: pyridoxamine 5'-phosphate oxidase family protein [Actinomycetota bacterium]|nr:pyridoxamine 5'-phosphate oxidase family protein [Actinomycetota bacterium]
MTTIDDVGRLARAEQGLAVVSTLRADQTIQSSLVNLAIMKHPFADSQVLAFVTYGKVKLANLRQRPVITATVRSGWKWATLEGAAEIIGPDDPHPQVDSERLRLLLREVFSAAGGTHNDWSEYDRVMVADRRSTVLVAANRIYGS